MTSTSFGNPIGFLSHFWFNVFAFVSFPAVVLGNSLLVSDYELRRLALDEFYRSTDLSLVDFDTNYTFGREYLLVSFRFRHPRMSQCLTRFVVRFDLWRCSFVLRHKII